MTPTRTAPVSWTSRAQRLTWRCPPTGSSPGRPTRSWRDRVALARCRPRTRAGSGGNATDMRMHRLLYDRTPPNGFGCQIVHRTREICMPFGTEHRPSTSTERGLAVLAVNANYPDVHQRSSARGFRTEGCSPANDANSVRSFIRVERCGPGSKAGRCAAPWSRSVDLQAARRSTSA